MPKTRTKEISIIQSKGGFSLFKKTGSSGIKGIGDIRRVLSNERARIISIIKLKSPASIYELARILDRNFKSVSEDVNLLKQFGIIDLKPEHTKKRKRLRPVLAIDALNIHIKM